MIKTCIYTVVLNQYDFIFPPAIIDKNIEFILITDDIHKSIKGWKTIPIKESLKDKSPIFVNRYYKMMPHLFFSNYDVSIYIDGNIAVIGFLEDFIKSFFYSEFSIGMIKHPTVLNAKEDINQCIKLNKIVDEKQLKNEYQNYLDDGFLDKEIYTENNVIIRKHNNSKVIKAMELWWECFKKSFNKRDQISLPYVRQKLNLDVKIYELNVREKNNNLEDKGNYAFKLYPHRSKKIIQNLITIIYAKSLNSKFFKMLLVLFQFLIKINIKYLNLRKKLF